jgi:signal transduction histidine kinase
MVSASADHLLALINDVLDLSKIEAGQLTLALEPVDVAAVVRKAASIMRPDAETKHLALEVDVAPDIGLVRGDSRRVEQVLLNLLSNAIKFTDQGRVRVVCARQGEVVVISVIDTGIGIRKADMDKLFKPFSQVDTGLTRKYEGTGLGLSISRRLVEMMGGSIHVDSIPGEGSTFRVVLPGDGGTS